MILALGEVAEYDKVEIANGDTVLLCEGKDELNLIHRLDRLGQIPRCKVGIKGRNTSDREEVVTCVGDARIRGYGIKFGLIYDAEDSAEKTERKLQSWLLAAGLNPPGAVGKVSKTVFGDTIVHVGYLILPANQSEGRLEDVFLPQVESHKNYNCLKVTLECLAKNMSLSDPGKTLIRMHIAAYNPYSTTIKAGLDDAQCLSLDCAGVDIIKEFITLLSSVS